MQSSLIISYKRRICIKLYMGVIMLRLNLNLLYSVTPCLVLLRENATKVKELGLLIMTGDTVLQDATICYAYT